MPESNQIIETVVAFCEAAVGAGMEHPKLKGEVGRASTSLKWLNAPPQKKGSTKRALEKLCSIISSLLEKEGLHCVSFSVAGDDLKGEVVVARFTVSRSRQREGAGRNDRQDTFETEKL